MYTSDRRGVVDLCNRASFMHGICHFLGCKSGGFLGLDWTRYSCEFTPLDFIYFFVGFAWHALEKKCDLSSLMLHIICLSCCSRTLSVLTLFEVAYLPWVRLRIIFAPIWYVMASKLLSGYIESFGFYYLINFSWKTFWECMIITSSK